MKEVIREVLNEKLKGKTYDVAAAGQWSEEIAVMIKDRVKGLFPFLGGREGKEGALPTLCRKYLDRV